MCFGTEHRHGAILSELESEAEPLYEQENRMENGKPHSLKDRRRSDCFGVGVGRFRISLCCYGQH